MHREIKSLHNEVPEDSSVHQKIYCSCLTKSILRELVMKKIAVESIDYKELLRGSRDYVLNEKRDSIYKVATFLVNHFWYRPTDIADGIGVLLLIWNQAFYRYCNFALDFEGLERFLRKNEKIIKKLRNRDISSFSKTDENTIRDLFDELLDILKCKDRKSPVAVSKALHLLAPNFFIPWDDDISKGYRCYWYYSSQGSKKYLEFMWKMKRLSQRIITEYANDNNVDRETAKKAISKESSSNLPFTKSLLKIIDEYNYAFTKYWSLSR